MIVSNHVSVVLLLASIASPAESFSAARVFSTDHCKPPTTITSTTSLRAISNPLRRRKTDGSQNTKKKKFTEKDALIAHITDVTDYKTRVVDESHNITVVRFYSHYCKSCRASEPHFFKLAKDYQQYNVNFVEVPLTPQTKVLHDALGVPSLPWTHIYHPDAGLVEERKVSKKFIEEVRQALRCYVFGECSLEDAPEGCMEVYGECAIDEDWNEK
jgi:thiol-disulfide isomerase/thioredoxin